jgi:hypothetical protein
MILLTLIHCGGILATPARAGDGVTLKITTRCPWSGMQATVTVTLLDLPQDAIASLLQAFGEDGTGSHVGEAGA